MRRERLLPLLFVLLLAAPLPFLLFSPDRSFSENENRYLTQAPALRAKDFLGGSLQEDLELWLADQFPGRDGWMTGVTVLDKALGQREIGGAWLGEDGYYLEVHRPEDFDWTKYRRNLGYLAQLEQEADVPATALLIPCGAAVLTEKLPAGAEVYDASEALRTARAVLPGAVIPDLTSVLRAAPREQVFYRTDHHWTAAGALRAYRALPLPFGAGAGTTVPFCEDFYGTTWSRTLDPSASPDTVSLFPVSQSVTAEADGNPIAVYDEAAADRKDKYTVYLGGNHGLVRLRGGCRNGKTLLVLKDSFANCLAPLLAADYETVLLVDLRYYAGSVRKLVQEERPDGLLFVYEMSGLASGDDFVKLLI